MLSVSHYEKYSPLKDIDIDLAPSKRPYILKKIREERGELNVVQVATFGTESAKAAITCACRGYRSKDYPNGIDVDEAQYLSSFVPIERGFPWPLEDMINGNAAKGRKPLTNFIKEMNRFPGLLDIALGISGLVSRRGSHASGVIFFDSDKIYDTCPIMKPPSGAIITQWDLHNVEKAGAVKYDFLLTSVQDIIVQTI